MKDYFSKENKKAMKEYGIDVISKLNELKKEKFKPFKGRPRGEHNHIWKKIKEKVEKRP